MATPAQLSLLIVALLGCGVFAPTRGHAQWWTSTPADFEDCAERAERSSAAKAEKLGDCEAKFAGRRKPGGGYSYYDFMQNRSFDIAGPNPTPAEQKAIDEQYTVYLDHQRRNVILAAFAQKQRELQMAALEPAAMPAAKAATAAAKDVRPVTVVTPRPRPKAAKCSEPFACGWSRLTDGVRDLKKVLFGPPAKTKRS
ncbi:hypothetical protein BH11PSE4_BH11PSE4_23610 [soil metagenome]